MDKYSSTMYLYHGCLGHSDRYTPPLQRPQCHNIQYASARSGSCLLMLDLRPQKKASSKLHLRFTEKEARIKMYNSPCRCTSYCKSGLIRQPVNLEMIRALITMMLLKPRACPTICSTRSWIYQLLYRFPCWHTCGLVCQDGLLMAIFPCIEGNGH